MEEIKKEDKECCKNMCENGSCKKWCCGGKKHGWLCWILGIVILIVVFSVGMKIGEFKGAIFGYGGFNGCGTVRTGYPMMFNGYNEDNYGNFGPGRMMRGGNIQYWQGNGTTTQQ